MRSPSKATPVLPQVAHAPILQRPSSILPSLGGTISHVTLAVVVLLTAVCCSEEPSGSTEPPVVVKAIVTGATEVALQVHGPAGGTLELYRGDSLITAGPSANTGGFDIDEGLTPSTEYTYHAIWRHPTAPPLYSSYVPVRTMETTSHIIDWQAEFLGDGSGSELYDVAIVNDTLVYAVGDLYKSDSLGGFDPERYNLAIWNGRSWRLERVTVMFRGNLITDVLEGIFARAANDIWVISGVAIHWDGIRWTPFDYRTITGFDSLSATKCWVSDDGDLYAVGRGGTLVSYSRGTWRRYEPGTRVDINDVWGGTPAGFTDPVVMCVSSEWSVPSEKRAFCLLRNGSITELGGLDQNLRLQSVWFDAHSPVYVVGDWVQRLQGDGRWRVDASISPYTLTRIRGRAANDLYAVGAYGELVHFNGQTWQRYPELSISGRYWSVATRGNLVVAVGYAPPRAITVIGLKRN